MIENQYILEPVGLLDAAAAERIAGELRSLLRAGRRHVRIAAGELRPILPEGIASLERECARIAAEFAPGEASPAPEGVRIDIFELSEQGGTQFLLRGSPVSEHSLVLVDTHQPPLQDLEDDATPEPEEASVDEAPVAAPADAAPDEAAGRIIRCESCGYSVRVPAPGDYGCPNCGATFHMGAGGEVAFFEMSFAEEGDDSA